MIDLVRIAPHGYHPSATSLTAILPLLLAGLLIAIELLRAYDERRTRRVRRELMIAGAPLLVGSVAIVALRLVPLLN